MRRFCVLYLRIAMALVERVDSKICEHSRIFGQKSYLETTHEMHLQHSNTLLLT